MPRSPMLARPSARADLAGLVIAGYAMEPKFDGDRAIAEKVRGRVSISSRSGRDVTSSAPAVVRAMGFLPFDAEIDGELAVVARRERFKGRDVPICDFAATRSAMGRGRSERIEMIAFDVLSADGSDVRGLPWSERRRILELVAGAMEGGGVTLSPTWPRWSPADVDALVGLGAEGAVMKHPASRYREGSRPAGAWVKYKPVETAEAAISGYVEGKGRLAGTIGAIALEARVGGRWTRIGSCAGFGDDVRRELEEDREGNVGRIVEVAYSGRVGEGAMRHPRFVRFRDDLSRGDLAEGS